MIKSAGFAIVAIIQLITTCDGQYYPVRYLGNNAHINVNGKPNEPQWYKADSINTFISAWKNDPIEQTVFRAAYDDSFFYFTFTAHDKIIITSENKEEFAVTEADRVELFFSRDSLLNPYYCFEISPTGIVYDYEAQYHRQFFAKWHAEGVLVHTAVHEDNYIIEGSMPLSLIKTISGIENLHGKTVFAGVFRADKDVRSGSQDDFTWISWIRPAARQPDFHIPSALGTFTFE
jgi:hypothetical protein